MKLRIRWRIALPYVILILITMFGLGIYLSNFLRQSYLHQLNSELSAEATLASDIVAEHLITDPGSSELDALASLWAEQIGKRFTIIDAEGVVVGESHEDRTQMDNHANRPEIEQARQYGIGSSTRYSQTLGDFLMYTAVTIEHEGELLGYVRLALPLQQVQAYINQIQRTLLSITFIITIIAILLAIWIASYTTRPLSQLTQTAVQITNGEIDHTQLAEQLSYSTLDEIGQLTRAFNAMAVNISAQIDTLESERGKMAAVLNEMSDGVLIADQHGSVQLINPAAENMFAIELDTALDCSLAEVLRHHQLIELWQQCQLSGEAQFSTTEIRSRNLFLQCVATPLGQALPNHTLLLFQDLTQLRRSETIRQDFISNISHELRTPLAALKALTETLQEGALDDPPAAKHFLHRMETEIDALSLMVTELLELSRIESGRVPLKMGTPNPCAILNGAVERLKLQAERADLTIEIQCPPNMPSVLADETRLEQVLVNLLHNAIKFTPSGGIITLGTEQLDDFISFSVIDTGIGISADDLPRVFERFYKADRARTTVGTGLGLAIARHLVEAHDGKIWAESSEGQGSKFYFTIPIAT